MGGGEVVVAGGGAGHEDFGVEVGEDGVGLVDVAAADLGEVLEDGDDLAVEEPSSRRLMVAFEELALAMRPCDRTRS